ncbi:hypothetical protein MCOR15_007299 [Pyricularia oryzae]|nr:hypothetical protein MCOR15_007299 [Pyricularia oryzae]
MTTNGISIIFGGACFVESTVEEVDSWLNVLERASIKNIDTAELYGQSQFLLGKTGAPSRFTIDTKVPGGLGGDLSTAEAVFQSGKRSLELGADKVDILYIHSPDTRLPWNETMSGLDKLHKQGAFKRLGLSNFRANQIEEIMQTAKTNNFVLPSVYQGNYSAVARHIEVDIFPIIRKYGMAFYVYSPSAGGFLTRPTNALNEGRFGKDTLLGKLYNSLYNKPGLVEALDVWGKIAEDEGVERGELAYRWVVYHSKLEAKSGDGIIVGASKQQQLEVTVEWLRKGPLTDGTAGRINALWELVNAEAPIHNV